jgi:uncharacterized protein (DUF1501 family)
MDRQGVLANSRRAFLRFSGAWITLAGIPSLLADENRDRALVCAYIMAGGSDVELTESLNVSPALPELRQLYSSGIAAIVNKVSPPEGYGPSASQRYSALRFLNTGSFTSKWASPESSPSLMLPSGLTMVSRSEADAGALAAAAATAALRTVFPETAIGQQFRDAAAVLRMRKSFGLTYPVLTTVISGFRPGQPELNSRILADLSRAMGSFYEAMVELGLAKHVTTYTDMDFGPAPKEGRSQIVMGGSVHGGQVFSANAGVTSYEAYTAKLVRWQGAAPTAGTNELMGLID